MRIALVVSGGVDQSGRERVIPSLLWLMERLARRHDVHVFVLQYLSAPSSYPMLGGWVHDLGRPSGFRAQQRGLFSSLGAHGPFNVVHAYWALPAGLHASVSAYRMRIPSVVTLDSGELVAIPAIGYGLQGSMRQHLAVALTCRLASRLTVCTNYQADLARAKGYAVDVIPLGVDTNLFQPQRRVEGPPWRLIHVASLNRVKDQPLLLEVVRCLRDNGTDVRLDVVGEDTLNGRIQDLSRSMGLESAVTFHGFKPSAELVPLYHAAHLAILTSHHEAAGVVTLEAAACGVPTVGTNVGYVSDWNGSRALAVPSRNPADIASAVARMLSDRTLRETLANEARAWTLAHNADWTASRMEQLYEGVTHR